MQENGNRPKIRFKEFKDEWEQCKLSSITMYHNGKCHEDKQADEGKYELINLNSISIDGGLKPSGKFINDAEETLSENDLVMILSDVGHGDLLGRVALIPESNKFVLNQRVALLRTNKKANPQFLFSCINAKQAYFKQQGTGSSQLNISKESVENFSPYIPSLKEQGKIAEFFENIDELIRINQHKYESLTNLRKTMLKKMFPKAGESVPEIRFKEFSGNWKKRKLGDIFEYERPDKYIVKSEEYSDTNETPVLTANKAFILGYTNEKNTCNKASIIFDDFTLDCKYVDFPYMVKSSAIKILDVRNKTTDNLRFAHELLKSTNIEVLGHARHYISVVQPIEVLVPTKEEQDKIADYFVSMDRLIGLQEQKIEKLKNIKKTCLNKMIV